jgi:hypothetical protein
VETNGERVWSRKFRFEKISFLAIDMVGQQFRRPFVSLSSSARQMMGIIAPGTIAPACFRASDAIPNPLQEAYETTVKP